MEKKKKAPSLNRPLRKYLDKFSKLREFTGAAAQIYTGIKFKQPLLVANGVSEALEKLYDEVYYDEEPMCALSAAGYMNLDNSQSPLVEQAIIGLIPHNKNIQRIGKELKYQGQTAVEYSIYDHRIYILKVQQGSSLYVYIYYHEVEVYKILIEITAEWLQRKFSRFTRLTVNTLGDQLIGSEIKIDNNRISLFNEQETLDRTLKFLNKGISRSMLLIGPAGSGKTTFARWLASQLPEPGLLALQCNDLSAILRGSMTENLLKLVELLKPPVILLDDVDRITSSNEYERDLLYLFTERLSEYPSVLIGTANELSYVSPALRRPGRFDETVIQTCPSLEQTAKIIKLHVEKEGTRLSQDNINKIAGWAHGLTPAYLREIAKRATIYEVDKLEQIIIEMKGLCPDAYPKEDWATKGF